MNLFWLALSLVFSSGQASTSDEIRSAIKGEISQRHPEPSAPFWTSLGPDALPVILQMYSESNSTYEKTWLIDGLGYFSDPSVGAFLESEISATSNVFLKKKLLNSLIQSQGEAELGFAEPYLKDPDPHVRLELARAIRQFASGKTADDLLANFTENEKMTWVKDELKRTSAQTVTRIATPPVVPLPESAWPGHWEGVFIANKKSTPAEMVLTLLNANPTPLQQKWKVELKLRKLTQYEVRGKSLDVVYFQTGHQHWLEVRNKTDDSVFMGVRK